MTRRERWVIMGAILDAIDEASASPKAEARVTNVALRSNVPYDRLMAYLDELALAGLVEPEKPPRLTEKGREFLRHYRQWREVISRFGLE